MEKLVELNREYWVRVHDMCAGTDVKPYECVRWSGNAAAHPTAIITENSQSFNAEIGEYEFAVAILKDGQTGKDRPVWGRDTLYSIEKGTSLKVLAICTNGKYLQLSNKGRMITYEINKINEKLAFHPPKPERTFTISVNDGEPVELPCPVKHRGQLAKTGVWIGSTRNRFDFWFASKRQCDEVVNAIEKILTEARDK